MRVVLATMQMHMEPPRELSLAESVVVQRCPVEIPDNEHGFTQTYRGLCVRDVETGCYMGDCWRDARGWCYRTLGCEFYGHADNLRIAILTLRTLRRAFYASCGVGA